MHEFADQLLPPPVKRRLGRGADLPQGEPRGAARAPRRAQLSRPPTVRRELDGASAGGARPHAYPVLGFYWPIRGELDLRASRAATSKPATPRRYPWSSRRMRPSNSGNGSQATAMQRGVWNIPVPAERRVARSGRAVDSARRLRRCRAIDSATAAATTTARSPALTPRPVCIGVGYDEAALATIHPQPHDIPMDWIVTERRVQRVGRSADAPQGP